MNWDEILGRCNFNNQDGNGVAIAYEPGTNIPEHVGRSRSIKIAEDMVVTEIAAMEKP